MSSFVIDGFIRDIQRHINSQIIPISINKLIANFFDPVKFDREPLLTTSDLILNIFFSSICFIQWFNLETISEKRISWCKLPFFINNKEIVFCERLALYKYNVITHKMDNIEQLLGEDCCAFDYENNILYTYNGFGPRLYITSDLLDLLVYDCLNNSMPK